MRSGEDVLDFVCNKLAYCLVNNKIIGENEQEEYAYGFTLWASRLFITLSILIVALLTGLIIDSALFVTSFLFLKNKTPTYHCGKYVQCFSLTMSFYLVFITIVAYMPNADKVFASQLMTAATMIVLASKIVLIVSPEFKLSEVIKGEKRSLVKYFAYCLIVIIAGFIDIPIICISVSYSLMICSLLYKPREALDNAIN